ncbi:hypothetical protein FOXB_08827 [Fusarium oxysporum f. sp. conglutinans Fo5176]|uniref:Uncharacterized protein n=1 Tax=Fusarium oxysporum (strain Fo5176) TaxID=660025 RepID=F9FQZ7_FUSOF|nr:hypothetical protein FOXB_08827 [Fusarium oxysporum f. sp. conglutinans Fo5176]
MYLPITLSFKESSLFDSVHWQKTRVYWSSSRYPLTRNGVVRSTWCLDLVLPNLDSS